MAGVGRAEEIGSGSREHNEPGGILKSPLIIEQYTLPRVGDGWLGQVASGLMAFVVSPSVRFSLVLSPRSSLSLWAASVWFIYSFHLVFFMFWLFLASAAPSGICFV